MRMTFLCILILSAFIARGQKYALVDKDFKKPILFTDSVTINQVSSNYFPIHVKDFDTLLANLGYLKGQLKSVQRAKFKSYKLKSGSTTIQINTVPQAYGDAFDIFLISSINNINAEYLLADHKILNKKAVKKIESFTKFMRKDASIMINEFKEYQPVIFDATIFIPSKQ
jgi:hypothetical protein